MDVTTYRGRDVLTRVAGNYPPHAELSDKVANYDL